MKQNIIFGLGGLGIGVLIGGAIGYFIAKKHEAIEENEEPEYIHLEYFDKTPELPASDPVDYANYSAFAAEAEHPQDDEEEEKESIDFAKEREAYKKEHEGRIEMMKLEDWDSDFPEEDYDHQELWYFPETGELTDEDGALLEPMEKYVGNIFARIGWDTNNDESICIRNHILEKDFKIWKQPMITKEEFFHY